MAVSSYYIAIIVGLTLSLLIEIKLGVTPGGLIVPSYIAMVLDDPAIVLNIFLVALLTYLSIRFVVSKFILVYGKRRFIACIMLALLFKFLLDLLYPTVSFSVLAFNGIGVVTSGILANTFFRQGVVLTTGTTIATSVVVFGVMNLFYLF